MILRMMILRRRTDPKTGTHTLCKPAQSKCTWKCHKSNLLQKNAGKMPRTKTATQTLCEPAHEMHLDVSQKPFCARIYRKNAGAQVEHPDQAPASTPTVRTPQCRHTVWGKKCLRLSFHFKKSDFQGQAVHLPERTVYHIPHSMPFIPLHVNKCH